MKRPIEIIRGAYGSIINASCEIIEDDSKLEKYRNKNIHQGQNMEPKELFFLKDECSICKILCDSDRYRLFKIEGKVGTQTLPNRTTFLTESLTGIGASYQITSAGLQSREIGILHFRQCV